MYLRDRAYRAVPEKSRICGECARDYRSRHAEFAVDWFTSYSPSPPAQGDDDDLAQDR